MRFSVTPTWLFAGCLLSQMAAAVDIDWTSEDSVKAGAGDVAWGLMKYYTGNNSGDVAGNLPAPYYWWEAGAFFGTFVDYWFYTGDDSYVNVTFLAMQHQIGGNNDFMPPNQTSTEGNDDQGFWALAAMTAAETNFLNPNETVWGGVQWLALAQAVFNEYVSRWDPGCGGGMRWQIFNFNNGWWYKNSISNGCFFDLAARLARYTGNSSYADWAVKVYDWMEEVQFIDADYNVYDGAGFADNQNCTVIDNVQYTYNAGVWLHGSAVMYNYTNGSSLWAGRVTGLMNRTAEYFFNNSVMYEPACEPQNNCDTDALSFKTYLARWMAGTVQMAAPLTYSVIQPLLLATAQAAALQCSGSPTVAQGYKGHPGTACGSHWVDGAAWDGTNGVGQQMAGLAAIFYSQVSDWSVKPPYTTVTGGTSQGNAAAGTSNPGGDLPAPAPITTGDRFGAGLLTTLALIGLLWGCGVMIKD